MPRRGLSADLAEMLREEAAREVEARAAEGSPRPVPESGPELMSAALPSLADLDRAEEERLTEVRRQAAAKPPTPTARRTLLPDIEEINSSLRPSGDQHDDASEPDVVQRKRGARFGFTTIMLIIAILVGLYLGAARLSAWIPAAEPVLTRYVAVVDDLRLWIDLKMQSFIDSQSAPAASDAAPPDPTPPDVPATPAPDDVQTTPDPAEPAAPETEAPAAPPQTQTDGN